MPHARAHLTVVPTISPFTLPASSEDPEVAKLDSSSTVQPISEAVAEELQVASKMSVDDLNVMWEPGVDSANIEVGYTNNFFIKPREKRTQDYVTGCFG